MMREVNDAKIARINGAQIKAGKTLKDHPNWMTEAQVSLLPLSVLATTTTNAPSSSLAQTTRL